MRRARSTSTTCSSFPSDCPAEEMDAEDPLFLLYTSGSTGKPKGVVHVHGGYMVGTTYHLESFYDVGDRDVFWCTSDIGWVVGHSYIVYAPLCAGVTTLFREGAIDYPNPGVAWEIVERYGVTKMFTAPTACACSCVTAKRYPAAHDLTTLRVIACAGEPLNPEAWRWAQTHLAGDGKWGYVTITGGKRNWAARHWERRRRWRCVREKSAWRCPAPRPTSLDENG